MKSQDFSVLKLKQSSQIQAVLVAAQSREAHTICSKEEELPFIQEQLCSAQRGIPAAQMGACWTVGCSFFNSHSMWQEDTVAVLDCSDQGRCSASLGGGVDHPNAPCALDNKGEPIIFSYLSIYLWIICRDVQLYF